jgi:hypothetical protein
VTPPLPGADRPAPGPAPRELSTLASDTLRILVWIAVGTWLATTVAHLADLALFGRQVLLLDVESHQSVAGWASSTVLVLAAAAAGLLAIVRRPVAWSFVVLAIALALLSADDDIGIFDQILRHRLPARPDPDVVIWVVSFGPLMAITFLLLGRLARQAPADIARTLWWGLGLIVIAILGELLVSAVDIQALTVGNGPYELEVAMEEGFELLGAALIAAALFATLVEGLVHARNG